MKTQPVTGAERQKLREAVAYIIGLLSEEEQAVLERRGWEIEDCPPVQSDSIINPLPDHDDGQTPDGRVMKLCWVDSDMFQVMTGPDWEDAPEHPGA